MQRFDTNVEGKPLSDVFPEGCNKSISLVSGALVIASFFSQYDVLAGVVVGDCIHWDIITLGDEALSQRE